MNKKKYKHLLWGIGVVSLAIILTLLIVSQTYIRNLVYHERLSQMEEVTHQMFRSLDDVIWNTANGILAAGVALDQIPQLFSLAVPEGGALCRSSVKD